MIIKFNKYNETVDNPVSTKEYDMSDLSYHSDDAITFGYVQEDDYLFDDTHIKEYEKAYKEKPHIIQYKNAADILKIDAKNHYDKIFYRYKTNITYEDYLEKINNLPRIKHKNGDTSILYISKIGSSIRHIDVYSREKFDFPGRLWVNKNFMSFWKYPDNKKELLKIINDINIGYKIFFGEELGLDDNINIELYYDWSEYEPGNDDEFNNYIIKAKDFISSDQVSNNDINSPHNEKDYKKRKQWFNDRGIKSKKSKWKKWMKPFEKFNYNHS